ncbi:MAG: RidA family protein [Acidobacteriota bacterium]|nr:RidA family protein [Acidobacteriota bacterium]
MGIERILHQGAPTPRGPDASAVRAGDFIFVSGLGPVDDDDQYAFGDIQKQTRQTLLNLAKILASCGARLEDVVKCSIFLRDAGEFHEMNQVYSEFFGAIKPARTTIEARFLQGEMRVEIDCVAYRPR